MITSILIGLATGAALNIGVAAAAASLGVPAATAAGGLKLFRWGRRAKAIVKAVTPPSRPPIIATQAREPEGFKPTWMQKP